MRQLKSALILIPLFYFSALCFNTAQAACTEDEARKVVNLANLQERKAILADTVTHIQSKLTQIDAQIAEAQVEAEPIEGEAEPLNP